jgi:hypothetical protein
MSSNDQVILDSVLQQQRQQLAPTLSESEFFEVFAAEQALKDYDLSYEEIRSGIVDGGGDGGIDGIFVIANGELVHEDSDLSQLKKGVQLDMIVVQATTSAGFSESRLDRLTAATEDLFDLSKPLADFKNVYNEAVLRETGIFRDTQQSLASRFPQLRVMYYLASRATDIHPNVQKKADRLLQAVFKLFSNASPVVEFLGCSELLKLARTTPSRSFSLQLAENPISSAGQVGFVCLVRLTDFHAFVTDGTALQRHIFESNVRDYQGSTEVNQEIRGSLAGAGGEDFWWLNNGVTVLASKAVLSGKTLTIEDPQIVNGLQTSTEIYKHFSAGGPTSDNRTLLVRVIVPEDPTSRDRVIKATNSQTSIPPASLRATDKIHRDIEEYLKPIGLYYDRRKNFYKNEGLQVDKIVGIPYLAQAVMAIALRRPDNARSRPSSLLKKDDDYKQIFDAARPLALYHRSAVIMKRVEGYLRTEQGLSATDKGNIRFHVAMTVVALTLGKAKPTIDEISQLDLAAVTDARISEATAVVFDEFTKLGATDAIAKSADFLAKVTTRISAEAKSTGAPLSAAATTGPSEGG